MSTDYSSLGISPDAYAKAQERVEAKIKAGTNPLSPTIAKVGLVVFPILLVVLLALCGNGTIPLEAAGYVKMAAGIAGGCWGATLIGFAIKSIHSNKERIGETKFGQLVGKVVTPLKEKATYLKDKVVEKILDPIQNKLGPVIGPHKKAIAIAVTVSLFVATIVLAGLALSGIGAPATSIAAAVVGGTALIATLVARSLGKKEENVAVEDDDDSILLPPGFHENEAEEISADDWHNSQLPTSGSRATIEEFNDE